MPVRVKTTDKSAPRSLARLESRESLSSRDNLIAVYSLESRDASLDNTGAFVLGREEPQYTKKTTVPSSSPSASSASYWGVCFPPKVNEQLKLDQQKRILDVVGAKLNTAAANDTSSCLVASGREKSKHSSSSMPSSPLSACGASVYESQKDNEGNNYIMPLEQASPLPAAFSDDSGSSASWTSQNAVKFHKKIRKQKSNTANILEHNGSICTGNTISPGTTALPTRRTVSPLTSLSATVEPSSADYDPSASSLNLSIFPNNAVPIWNWAIHTSDSLEESQDPQDDSISGEDRAPKHSPPTLLIQSRRVRPQEQRQQVEDHADRLTQEIHDHIYSNTNAIGTNLLKRNVGSRKKNSVFDQEELEVFRKEMHQLVCSSSKVSTPSPHTTISPPTGAIATTTTPVGVCSNESNASATHGSEDIRDCSSLVTSPPSMHQKPLAVQSPPLPKQRSVTFSNPLVSSMQYRPKTRPEDVHLLFFDEAELELLEEDRESTPRDQFEMIAQELSENRLRISIAYQNRWREKKSCSGSSNSASGIGAQVVTSATDV